MNKKVGIQGGKGSFNHQGWLKYANEHNLNDFEIQFLHTTKNVLSSLENREIDLGQFGIYNTLGGLVEETAAELGKYKFEITDWYRFPIAHFLMRKKKAGNSDIKKIMAHPQGFKQCKLNIQKLFPDLEKIIGTGEMIDHAKIAEELSKDKLGDDIAVIGPEILAENYGLEIMAKNLQDDTQNFTTFVIVQKYSSNILSKSHPKSSG
ncbi:MAG: prephenate dehydratase domain-containing protein [Candidatus Paceibacterota bacterium]